MGRGGRRADEIPAAELIRLYRLQGFSVDEAARRLGWSPSAVRGRLVELGIERRTPWARNAVQANLGDLRRLYLEDGLSMSTIAERYGCSLTTVWRKLKAAGVMSRAGGTGPLYLRADFSGDPAEKAYLSGFRIGDLNIEREGTTIVVKCTSTRSEQLALFTELFEPYGYVYNDAATQGRRARQSIGMSTRLNMSFEFLLPKQDAVPEWVFLRDETFFAFFAGYVDAEGYFRTYFQQVSRKPAARLEVRSYDKTLLGQLSDGLCQRGILCPPARLRVPAGYTNRAGVRSNRDLWGLGVSRRTSLRELCERIEPYLRHARRRRDMAAALATC